MATAVQPCRLGSCWRRRNCAPSPGSQLRAGSFDWAVGGVPASSGNGNPHRRQPCVQAAFASPETASGSLSAPAASIVVAAPVCRRRHRPRSVVCAAATAAAAAATAASAAAAPAASSPLVASLAVLVGWLVIAGSCIRSLPQILRILKNSSVRGLSLTSFSSELLCYMISVAYNIANGYAFSTFGDTAICALQNVAIVCLIFRLGSVRPCTQLVLTAGLAGAACWLFSGACPPRLLTALQAGSVVLLALGGRMPQILLNLRRGNSGELSLLSCALSLAGNLARVFTTLTLVKDPIILGSAATQAVLNGILTWQTIETARQLRSSGTAPAPQAA